MTYHILRFYELCGTRSVSQVHDQDFLIQSLSGLISDASRGSKRTSALHLENSQPISKICAFGDNSEKLCNCMQLQTISSTFLHPSVFHPRCHKWSEASSGLSSRVCSCAYQPVNPFCIVAGLSIHTTNTGCLDQWRLQIPCIRATTLDTKRSKATFWQTLCLPSVLEGTSSGVSISDYTVWSTIM